MMRRTRKPNRYPTSLYSSMATASRLNFWLFSLLSLFCLFCTVKSNDLEILLNLKGTLQKSNAGVLRSWQARNPLCNFTGITCNSKGLVKEIDLSHRKLTGALPDLASICRLQTLEKLSFGFNYFVGIVVDDLINCSRLEYLDLANNMFTGSFPDISTMSRLQYLFLNNSGFSGVFPWESLTNMTNLVYLSLGDNPFDKTPFPREILNLGKLRWLYLSNCSVEGTIPRGIGNLTELVHLELADNYLSGEIPQEISKLHNLWMLELYDNELEGTLPAGFRNLTNLEFFDASDNYLHGNLSELRFLTKLVSLQLFYNRFSGEVPPEFGEFKQLVNISLYSNQLIGSLPRNLGSWAEFNFIDASENFLTGPIPPYMCNKGTMKQMLLLQNRFTGEIPSNYANCTTLTRIRVSNNSLTGTIPAGIWGLPNVNIIDIALNRFEGPITSEIPNAKSLRQLLAGNNRLSGELPADISKVSSLVAIDLNHNQISGQLPETLGDLEMLSSLHLENNKLSGKIPDSLGSCKFLSDLNLAQNTISGTIPPSLGSLPTLNSLNLSANQLSGEIPEALSSLRLSLLDLSQNKLTGRIPESLSFEAYNGSFVGNLGLCSRTVSSFRRCADPGMSGTLRTLIICFVSGAVVVLLALFLYFRRTQRDHERSLIREYSWDVKSFQVLTFTAEEILDGIKQENLIGQGGSGNVYRVTLLDSRKLAVKHICEKKNAGKSWEFDSEVRTLSSIRHINVVKLYCSIISDTEDASFLVYEYMPNGSLWDQLHTSRKMKLDWEHRYYIALGAAKGLEYLHHGCEKPVIHRDVKSSNILLDEFLKPKIADFGLAKIVQASGTNNSSHVVAGTHGYIAPEYGYTCKVDEKCDVYSFGVVLMELVTGKRPLEAEYGQSKDVVHWICSKMRSRESLLSAVDAVVSDATFKEEALQVLEIAIVCTARLPSLRPTMKTVVQMLEEVHACRSGKRIVGGRDEEV